MFDDDSYYSFKICELLLAESDLNDWVIDNPVLSTYNFLNFFNIFVKSLLENDFLSPIMKNNALNYLNLVRFNDDKRISLIDDNSLEDKILLINNMIREINNQMGDNYITYYRHEMYKRTANDDYLKTSSEFYIINSENLLLQSIKFDHMVLFSHSEFVDEEEFENDFLLELTSDLRYIETINCILEEYPNQFLNKMFFERYKKIMDIFINSKNNLYDSDAIKLFDNKVINRVKSLVRK